MSQFAVMVRGVDDSYTSYGPVRTREKAERFSNWFNARVEQYERDNPAERDGIAWAYVVELQKLGSTAMLNDSGLVGEQAQEQR